MKGGHKKTTEKLKRIVFEQSRELEFFSEKELEMQIGHGVEWWPIAILREIIDNALDGCENSNISPEIWIETDDKSFTVTDNGVGLSSQIIKKSQNYLKRVSDKTYYVSPTRGQMGNALKVIWAAPYVLNGEYGKVEIWSKGKHHIVEISLDRISQKPILKHSQESGLVKNGTKFKIHIPNLASLKNLEPTDFYNQPMIVTELIEVYAAFNPHATFHYNNKTYEPTDKNWKKWRADNPTSPHWYNSDTLRSLIAAYIKNENDGGKVMTVRKFVSEFKGLSSTMKQKRVTEGFSGVYLHDLIKNMDVDMNFVEDLLDNMKAESKPVKSHALGIIGEEHMKRQILALGCTEETFCYARKKNDDGLPHVMEFAFGVLEENIEKKRIITGMNWSPALRMPTHEIQDAAGSMRIDMYDPVVLIVHMAKPRFEFTDKGKTRISLSYDMTADICSGIRSVAKIWKAAKRHADREDRLSERQLSDLRQKPRRIKMKEAVFGAMKEAYAIVSSNGKYHANARQLMYRVRPVVVRTCDKVWKNSSYFTQTLLKDYLEEFNPHWKVVWDARGHIKEPHTDTEIKLGGVEVIKYVRQWKDSFGTFAGIKFDKLINTMGPVYRYGAVLFIEKEGFNEILEESEISKEFDITIMSTKGLPVGAACELANALDKKGVKIFVLHDFDFSGFKIVNTLRTGTRLAPATPNVIDFGFRLEDVKDLETEDVTYNQDKDPKIKLRDYGATEEECDRLVGTKKYRSWNGKRVELNVLTSEEFVEFIRTKLTEHDVEKIVPDDDVLKNAYKRAVHRQRILEKIDEVSEEMEKGINVPDNLKDQVDTKIKKSKKSTWDKIIWDIAENHRG